MNTLHVLSELWPSRLVFLVVGFADAAREQSSLRPYSQQTFIPASNCLESRSGLSLYSCGSWVMFTASNKRWARWFGTTFNAASIRRSRLLFKLEALGPDHRLPVGYAAAERRCGETGYSLPTKFTVIPCRDYAYISNCLGIRTSIRATRAAWPQLPQYSCQGADDAQPVSLKPTPSWNAWSHVCQPHKFPNGVSKEPFFRLHLLFLASADCDWN